MCKSVGHGFEYHCMWGQRFSLGLLQFSISFLILWGKALASTLNYFRVIPGSYSTILCIFIVDQLYEDIEQRPRSLSDPVINPLKTPENTFLQQSLHIVADSERKRRLQAEKKLEKLTAGQSVDLRFPELKHAEKSNQDNDAHDAADESDDNSSTTSTSDEGTVYFIS